MYLEQFAHLASPIHRLDPRVKLITAMVFSVVVALNRSLEAGFLALILPVLLILAARLPFRPLLSRLAVVNVFILMLWLFLPFNYPGKDVLFALGPWDATREGIAYALLITVNSNAIVLMMLALLATTPVFNVVHAMSHMGIPDKLVHLFFFCFRYIHVIHEEYHRLADAMKMRGFRPRTDLHTYRSYAYLLGMLLVRSFDRAQRIQAAMKCRGFAGRYYILHHYEMKRNDYLLAASGCLFSIVLMVGP